MKLKMISGKEEENVVAHQQQPLCTTRLPYRQGRKLTAVKAYSINKESNHLLVFGVPSLDLRREARDLLIHFGKLVQFHVAPDYPAEDFTQTYHACFQRIQSARIAKKMLDTKNFYGGSLHVCYAPEFETLEETRNKLLRRKNDVLFRLKYLQKDTLKPSNVDLNVNNEFECEVNINSTAIESHNSEIVNSVPNSVNNLYDRKLNMGENNVIYVNKNKRKNVKEKMGKRLKRNSVKEDGTNDRVNSLEVVDCTSVDKSVVSNINDALNYSKFGNEVIKKVDLKPMNKIVFNFNKKT